MKLLLIMLTVLGSFFTQASASEKVNPAVLKAFEKSFSSAKEVTWTASDDIYQASFALNEQYVTAFFCSDGELIALTRNITTFQLPIVLQSELRKNYSSYWISELFEVANDQGNTYYVTLETADSKIVLKSNSTYNWSTYKKMQKS
jgi:hypothetical protein